MTPRRVLIAAPDFQAWDLGVYVQSALESLHIPSATFAFHRLPAGTDTGAAFVEAVRTSKADAVIGLKLDTVPASAIRRVRAAGTRVLLWQVDCFTSQIPTWIRPLVREANVVAVTAHGMVDAYARLRTCADNAVHWVMEGAYGPAFPTVRLSAGARRLYGSEVAFVGGLGQPPVRNPLIAGHRERLLNRLGAEFEVRVWGPQSAHARHRVARRKFEVRRWPAYNDELSRVCQASSIVLGLNTINTVYQYFSNRTFLTLAAKGFHVTHFVPGLDALFENHRHLVWFKDDAECVDVCRHYLKRAAARQRIAAAGRAYVRKHWRLTDQVARLVQLLGDTDA
ncbi:MAG: glycosyltransferase [Vicinamibacterales bacterium]